MSEQPYDGTYPDDLDIEEEDLPPESIPWTDPGVLADEDQPDLEDEGDPDNPVEPEEDRGL